MSFLDPSRLIFLAGVAALAVVYVVLQQRRRQYAVRFTNIALLDQVAPKRPGWRRHAAAIGFLLAIGSLVLAFARPTHDTKVPREEATIVMAIDTSLSMEATDVTPTRIKAVQDAARSFLAKVPPKINVGLVNFNGVAQIDVAPTTDRLRVQSAIDGLQLGRGTAIGEAIFASLSAINQFAKQTTKADQAPVPARIVLMSDGATTTGRTNGEAVAAAKAAQVPVTTIAFGTDHGTVRLEGDAYPTQVPVNKDALREIADATSGQYFAAATEAQLAKVYQDIGSQVGYENKETEITTWFIGAALLALLATGAMSLAWFSRLP
jgi:Ca-activated chloride channel family protein